MRSRSVFFAIILPVFLALLVSAQQTAPKFTSPLPTGVKLDPAGAVVELGSLPINLVLAPEGDRVVVVLSGWREQGLQVVDLKTRQVTQTIKQDAAFYGAAFSPDGKRLYVSGGNEDAIYVYAWANGAASLEAKFILGKKKEDGTGSRYPAGIALSQKGDYLYVAENVGNGVVVVGTKSGDVVQRFPTERYPYAALASCGHIYVSAWGGTTLSEFKELADGKLAYIGRIEVGRHPSALAASGCGTLYAALAGSDRVAAIDTNLRRVTSYLHDSAPHAAPNEGSTPNAIAVSGARVFVAEADNNAVAVFEHGRLIGRIPTDWYATGVMQVGNELLTLSGKGYGTHANPDGPVPLTGWPFDNPTAYALGQLNGSLRVLPVAITPAQLAQFTGRVTAANNWQQAPAAPRNYPPFQHVIYIIKENRTYDQVLGDMKEGDGDPKLVYFPETVAPNHRALARRFGLWDRFFVNAEVSSQGHIWSTTAYITDFGEKTVPSGYAGKYPYVDGDDAAEPEHGFLWTLARKSGVTFRDYGEMVPGAGWPNEPKDLPPDVSPTYKPFDLTTLDQERIDAWLAEFNQFVAHGNMPRLEVMHLPNDHLAAGRPGKCTPRACMADNDLALARLVEALSHSPRWQDTVVFVVEDDAQAGPDHVDSHRAPFYAISAYSKPGTIHRFANTTDVIAAIEDILHMGRLSKYDYFSRSLADVFAATPDLTPYTPLVPRQDLNEKNPPKTAAAKLSEGLDLSAPDRVDDQLYNYILWVMLKGDEAPPAARSSAPLHALQSSQ
jgi:DNA-binding beta-propeller fold protein YncE